MFKKSSSRNQRSKGVKIKHGLQILLLLGICFWLIYQVKYSHDKKRELNEKDAKTAAKEESGRAVKFGRKDLHPLRDEMATITNHVEDEEESREEIDEASTIDKEESREENDENQHNEEHDEETSKHEVGLGEEGNNHEHDEREDANDSVTDQEAARRHEEEEEREEEENRINDPEVVREGGEDENDEPDEEKVQGEVDREEEFIDEEKEREEDNDERETEGDDGEDKEGQAEDENVSEDEEHNESESESGHSKHEAREENYKADDASSAVTHDTLTTLVDSEKLGLHDADDNSESSKTGRESNSTISDQINEGQDNSRSNMEENQVAEKAANSSEVVSQIKDHDDTKTGPANSSLLKPAITADPKEQEDAGVNSTEVNVGSINNLAMSGQAINGTENILDSPQAPNRTWVDAHASDGSNQQNIRVEMAKVSTGNSSSGESNSKSSIATTEVGNSSNFISDQTSTVKDENTSSDMKGEAENILKLPSMTKENDDHTHKEMSDRRSEAGSSNAS